MEAGSQFRAAEKTAQAELVKPYHKWRQPMRGRDPFRGDPFQRDPFERIRRQEELNREFTERDSERLVPNQPGYPNETQEAWREAERDHRRDQN